MTEQQATRRQSPSDATAGAAGDPVGAGAGALSSADGVDARHSAGDLVVRPVRFTDDVAAMTRFLTALGLAPRIESERGTWVDLLAGSGIVALHDASTSATGGRPGQTRLSFEVADVDVTAERLAGGGFSSAEVVDEAYGRLVTVVDPLGDPVVADGRSDDLYGYRTRQDPTPDARLRVVPVRFTDPRGPYGSFLEALGLFRRGAADDHYVMYDADGGGSVGLHHVHSSELPIVPGPGAVHLTFETTEPVEDVAARLVAAGYRDAVVEREDFGSMVSVTDPDGQQVQVHPLALSEQ